MKIDSIGEKIATREFELSGSAGKIIVEIGKPEPFEGGADYYCPYQIIGLAGNRVRYGAGIDGVQALIHALHNIGARLYSSTEHREGRLTWFGKRNLGIPVADIIADVVPKADD